MAPHEEGKRRSDLRVVVVDDNQIFRGALVATLASLSGVEVVGTAGSVADALWLVRLRQPHAVVMDAMLPDGTGMDATQQLMQDMPDLRVIMVSMFELEGLRSLATEAGAEFFIGKDRIDSELEPALRSPARRQRPTGGADKCTDSSTGDGTK